MFSRSTSPKELIACNTHRHRPTTKVQGGGRRTGSTTIQHSITLRNQNPRAISMSSRLLLFLAMKFCPTIADIKTNYCIRRNGNTYVLPFRSSQIRQELIRVVHRKDPRLQYRYNSKNRIYVSAGSSHEFTSCFGDRSMSATVDVKFVANTLQAHLKDISIQSLESRSYPHLSLISFELLTKNLFGRYKGAPIIMQRNDFIQ